MDPGGTRRARRAERSRVQDLERGLSAPRRETLQRLVLALDLIGDEKRVFEMVAHLRRRPPASSTQGVIPNHVRLMATLPSGIVAFLLTGVEASARLWQQQPEVMHEATIRLDVLIEQQVAQHHGVVVRPRGEQDKGFAVFERAKDSVAAACAIQLAVDHERWSMREPLKVRLALHTGDAGLRDADYDSLALTLCSRLRAIAYGGQVLVSSTTAEILRGQSTHPAGLRELGTYSLRHVSEPQTLFQLVHPDLTNEFPPLLANAARRSTLPTQATPLVGRETELHDLQQLLERPDVRLITIVGIGGVGPFAELLAEGAELTADQAVEYALTLS